MTDLGHVGAIRGVGFTERQARFWCSCSSILGCAVRASTEHVPGLPTAARLTRFSPKLIAGGFATTDLAAPAHAGRIYHLQYKPWYRLLGEPDHGTGG